MENKVLADIRKYNMISPGDNILVALSGGADSVALFYCMLKLKNNLKINVYAAHLNHGIRGEESDRDELFVKELCAKYNTELFTKNEHMAQRTPPKGMSTEKWARELRYAFLKETAKKLNAKIATAHTLSDNCETLMFNLARGASLKGSTGIPVVRENIIRPLIGVTRFEIERYCDENGLLYVTDSTNLTDDYSRNKIRHKVMPVLREISSTAENAIGRFTDGQRELWQFVSRQTDEFENKIKIKDGKYDAEKFKEGDALLQRFLVAKIMSRYIETDHTKLTLCLNAIQNGGAVQLKDKVFFAANGKYFCIKKEENIKKPMYEIPLETALEMQNLSLEGGYNISLKMFTCKDFMNFNKIHKKAFNYAADYGKIQDNMLFRTRRKGDVFTLPRRGCTKTVKKLFSELSIPQDRRECIPVLACENRVVWIYGIGFAAGMQSNGSNENVVFINDETEIN